MNKLNLKILIKESLMNKLGIVVGTRPSIIKMSPIIQEIKNRKIPFFVIHSGQHYTKNMSQTFFDDLNLPPPDYNCETVKEKKHHGEQTAEMLVFVEKILLQERPRILLVGGDANTNLAAALAARKLKISVGHVEAGLRSYNWEMPEEHNRVIIDHISDYLFAPSKKAEEILKLDNVRGKIFVVGSTIVDAINQNLQIAEKKSKWFNEINLNVDNDYLLMTVHREENVDDRLKFEEIISTIERISQKYDLPIIFPIHPRTKNRLMLFDLLDRITKIKSLKLTNPLGYLDFLLLLSKASIVLTDSGGVQQEACILRVPCITLRTETEWIETVEVKANIVTGTKPDEVLKGVEKMLNSDRDWRNPFGEEGSARMIIEIITQEILT